MTVVVISVDVLLHKHVDSSALSHVSRLLCPKLFSLCSMHLSSLQMHLLQSSTRHGGALYKPLLFSVGRLRYVGRRIGFGIRGGLGDDQQDGKP